MRQAEEFGEDDAGLAETEIVRLQAGQHQVGRLRLDGLGEHARHGERIELVQVIGIHVDGAIGALGQGLANGGAHALRAGGEDDHFAAVLLLELQAFFKGVGVRFVHGELDVGFFNPFPGAVDAHLRIALRDLLDGYDDLHFFRLSGIRVLAGRQGIERPVERYREVAALVHWMRPARRGTSSCRRGRRCR